MDDADRRNRLIEEQFPEGRAQSGFNYSFSQLSLPDRMIAFEVRMTNGDTLRLFFGIDHFRQFVHDGSVVLNEIDKEH